MAARLNSIVKNTINTKFYRNKKFLFPFNMSIWNNL